MYKTNITECIGGTPLLKLCNTEIYAKLEYFNPLHSVKDRAALYMIEGAEARGELKKGGTIIEATSGNTGIALAYIGRQKGYRVILTMPESMSEERRSLLRALGGELVLTPAAEGIKGAVERARHIKSETEGSYIPSQFDNTDCARAHEETTALEIIRDLGDTVPDYLVLVFGSAGTITGLAKILKRRYTNLKVAAVEPFESPLVSKGYAAPHKIQGIGANFIPKLYNKDLVDEVVTVKSEDAINAAKSAALKYGTLCGISSGAALFASEQIAAKHPESKIVTLFPDTGERYLSSGLYR